MKSKNEKEKENEKENKKENDNKKVNENENEIVGVLMNMKTHMKYIIDGIFDYSSSKNKCFKVFVKKKEKQKKYIARTENNNIKSFQNHAEINSEKVLFIINYATNLKMENALLKENMEENELNINLIKQLYMVCNKFSR